MEEMEYGGFWIRVGAALIDTIIVLLFIAPILTAIYGMEYWSSERSYLGIWDLVINYLFPIIAVILFWVYKSATPGKMMMKLTIVDAKTGGKPSTAQFIGRYLGYYASIIPFMLGIIWVGIDKRKQGWHDKLAGTLVVREVSREPVEFSD